MHTLSHLTRATFGGGYRHANFERANNLLCVVELKAMLNPSDIQSRCSCFKTTFVGIMEKCIPRALLPQRRNLPCLNKEIIQLIRKRIYNSRKPIVVETEKIAWSLSSSKTKLWQNWGIQSVNFLIFYIPIIWNNFVKLLNSKQSALSTLTSENMNVTSNLYIEKATFFNASFVKHYNHLLPGITLNGSPTSLLMVVLSTFSAEKKSMAYCLSLTVKSWHH